jgi:hypothetical protein
MEHEFSGLRQIHEAGELGSGEARFQRALPGAGVGEGRWKRVFRGVSRLDRNVLMKLFRNVL